MNSKHPQISVVIPAYNEENYLSACLESLKHQTFRDFEVIVVDNNSTDQTVKIAKRYGVRVVKEPIQGMTPARERGFKEAQAEIIARTDADTIVPSDWLDNIYNVFHDYPNIVAMCGSHICSEVGKTKDILLRYYFQFNYNLSRILMGHFQLSGPNYALRKSIWQKMQIHMDDSLVHEDIDISCHLAELGKIVLCPEIITDMSLRRFKRQFWATYFEYTIRYFRTIWLHHPYFRRHKSPINLALNVNLQSKLGI